MRCDDARRRLDEIESGVELATELSRHIDGCTDCHAYAASVRSVLDRVQELTPPRPERDLWPGIARRLAETDTRPGGGARYLWPLAASLLLTAALAVFLARREAGPAYSPVAENRIQVVAWEEVIEASRIRAEEVLSARVDEMPRDSQIALAENLERLDQAIREIRQAIDENPDHRQLEVLLAARIQQHARLIQRISHV